MDVSSNSTESNDENLFWNIPVANTTVILLGSGTSLTQAAVRVLASAGVMIGIFAGAVVRLFLPVRILNG